MDPSWPGAIRSQVETAPQSKISSKMYGRFKAPQAALQPSWPMGQWCHGATNCTEGTLQKSSISSGMSFRYMPQRLHSLQSWLTDLLLPGVVHVVVVKVLQCKISWGMCVVQILRQEVHLQDCGQSFVSFWSILHVPSKKRDTQKRIEQVFIHSVFFFVLPVERCPFWHTLPCFAGRTFLKFVHQQYCLHKGTAFPGAVSLTRWFFGFHPQLSRLQDKSNYRYPVVIWPPKPLNLYSYTYWFSHMLSCSMALFSGNEWVLQDILSWRVPFLCIDFPFNCPPIFSGGLAQQPPAGVKIKGSKNHRVWWQLSASRTFRRGNMLCWQSMWTQNPRGVLPISPWEFGLLGVSSFDEPKLSVHWGLN